MKRKTNPKDDGAFKYKGDAPISTHVMAQKKKKAGILQRAIAWLGKQVIRKTQ